MIRAAVVITTYELKDIPMNLPRPPRAQRVIALLASNLVAVSLLLGVLLTFDPALRASLDWPALT